MTFIQCFLEWSAGRMLFADASDHLQAPGYMPGPSATLAASGSSGA